MREGQAPPLARTHTRTALPKQRLGNWSQPRDTFLLFFIQNTSIVARLFTFFNAKRINAAKDVASSCMCVWLLLSYCMVVVHAHTHTHSSRTLDSLSLSFNVFSHTFNRSLFHTNTATSIGETQHNRWRRWCCCCWWLFFNNARRKKTSLVVRRTLGTNLPKNHNVGGAGGRRTLPAPVCDRAEGAAGTRSHWTRGVNTVADAVCIVLCCVCWLNPKFELESRRPTSRRTTPNEAKNTQWEFDPRRRLSHVCQSVSLSGVRFYVCVFSCCWLRALRRPVQSNQVESSLITKVNDTLSLSPSLSNKKLEI